MGGRRSEPPEPVIGIGHSPAEDGETWNSRLCGSIVGTHPDFLGAKPSWGLRDHAGLYLNLGQSSATEETQYQRRAR